MGLYDRDYLREDESPGMFGGGPGARPMVVNLIIVTTVIFVADVLLNQRIRSLLWLTSNTAREPWNLWKLLTYGFVHDDIWRIFLNMLCLFFFGREMEMRYGRREFLLQYLAFIVFAGAVWLAASAAGPGRVLLGASGGVAGVMMLFICTDPHRTILLMGIVPVPAWLCLVLFLVGNLQGLVGGESNIAYVAHLAGAAAGFAVFRFKWQLSRWMPEQWPKLRFRRPKLRIHTESTTSTDADVDRVLAKMKESGSDSLTRDERKILEDASRRYQRRKRDDG